MSRFFSECDPSLLLQLEIVQYFESSSSSSSRSTIMRGTLVAARVLAILNYCYATPIAQSPDVGQYIDLTLSLEQR